MTVVTEASNASSPFAPDAPEIPAFAGMSGVCCREHCLTRAAEPAASRDCQRIRGR